MKGQRLAGLLRGAPPSEAEGVSKADERSSQRDRREGGGATGALAARGGSIGVRSIDSAKRWGGRVRNDGQNGNDGRRSRSVPHPSTPLGDGEIGRLAA